MAKWTAQHDTITCNVAISACDMNRQRKRALGLLAEMAKKTVQRDATTGNPAINAGGKCEESSVL